MKVRSFLSAVGCLSLVLLLFFIQTNGAYSQALNDVGAPGFSVGLTGYNALAFNGANPFVAYQHGFYISKSTVMKFDGTNRAAAAAQVLQQVQHLILTPVNPSFNENPLIAGAWQPVRFVFPLFIVAAWLQPNLWYAQSSR